MAEVLTVMAVATFINDAMEVWDKIEKSFARVSQNQRGAQRLVREIRNDLILLKDLYEDHHATLDKSARTETAIRTLIENMEQALGMCSQSLPPVSEKRFKKYTLKYYMWKNGSKIEDELLDLKSHVSDCRQRFQTLAIARVEIGAIEHHRVHVSRTDVIQNMLSDLTVSANRLRAYHPAQSAISPSIVIDIPDEYLKIILSAISKAFHTEVSSQTLMFLEILSRQTFQGSNNDLFPHDRESLHRDTVAFALYTHRDIKYFMTDSKVQFRIIRLTRMARRLGMSEEADSIDWRRIYSRNIIDKWRPQIHSLPHPDSESMVSSSNSDVLRHLDMLDHKVDLFLRFCEHLSEAADESYALWGRLRDAYYYIWEFHWRHQDSVPEVEEILEEIETLRRWARRIHELHESLPLLDI